ncbi:MAG: U32 family peptidase C-terminal domain-containing protein [Patescibacteria group bacterium]
MNIELLAPAGDFEKLKVALAFGADAVYAGIPLFSLRARENDFSISEIRKAVAFTRAQKKKIYLTVNTFPRDCEFKKLENFLAKIHDVPPDAFIFSDLGVMQILKKYFPKTPLHLSVQANTVNSAAVKVWQKLGVRRIILARELSIREIRKIVVENPQMEFETFVHGAICVSYSGRCLLSMYLNSRDANRGKCSQPCRWKYSLEEEQRSGEYFPIEEDSQGSYILNSRDLCLLEKIPQLARAGILSLKIEGRNKTVGYLATITRAYRKALDDFAAGKKFDQNLRKEILSTGNRGFTLGFFDGSLKNLQNYERSRGENPQNFLGLVEKKKDNYYLFEVKNRFEKGDKIEAVIPRGGVKKLKVGEIRNEKFQTISLAHGGQKEKVWLHLNCELPPFTLLRKC